METRDPSLARDLATQDRSPLCPGLIEDIFTLGDFMGRVHALPDATKWIRTRSRRPRMRENSAGQTPPPVTARSTLDAIPAAKTPRVAEDFSKRATVSGTSDSDISQHNTRRPARTRPDTRQVTPRIYHAAEGGDSDEVPFPPQISRLRESAPRPSSRVTSTSAVAASQPACTQCRFRPFYPVHD